MRLSKIAQFLIAMSLILAYCTDSNDLLTLNAAVNPIHTIAWSPDGRKIALGYSQGRVKVLDAATKQFLFQILTPPLLAEAVSWHPNSTLLAVGDGLGFVMIVNAQTQKVIKSFSVGEAAYSVRWNASGTKLAVIYQIGTGGTGDYGVKVWDMASGEIKTIGYGVASGSWSPDGTRYLTGGMNAHALVWDMTNFGTLIYNFQYSGEYNIVTSVDWSQDGQRFAVGTTNGELHIYDANSGTQLRTFMDEESIYQVVWSPGGRRIATGNAIGQLRVWDIDEGTSTLIVQIDDPVEAIAWSPDGGTLAYGKGDEGVQYLATQSDITPTAIMMLPRTGR